jgi:hypothetical protein
MKCRPCSSGLYICMIAPLSTRACSSSVRASAWLELSGIKKAVMISKTLNCALPVLTSSFLIERVRGSAEFLSDYFCDSKLCRPEMHRTGVQDLFKKGAVAQSISVPVASASWIARIIIPHWGVLSLFQQLAVMRRSARPRIGLWRQFSNLRFNRAKSNLQLREAPAFLPLKSYSLGLAGDLRQVAVNASALCGGKASKRHLHSAER